MIFWPELQVAIGKGSHDLFCVHVMWGEINGYDSNTNYYHHALEKIGKRHSQHAPDVV